MKKITTEEFVDRAIKVHGNKYDYSKVEYSNIDSKVCIICPIHGEFWQTPYKHLKGQGCKKCKFNNWNSKTIIQAFKNKWGNKYDYSRVEYKGYHTKLIIICPIHGEFLVTPANFLIGRGCPKCKAKLISNKQQSSREEFIWKAKKVHENKYDYSKVEYINSQTKTCIICPIHGEFWQIPNNHLKGEGCPKCSCEKTHLTQTKTNTDFIEGARKIHGDKYDYSKVEYKNNKTKVCIICPTHGEFWQIPSSHLNGRGCPCCNESHLECEIEEFLKKEKIKYQRIKHFKWLGGKSLDFYLEDYNAAIECQGIQHFKEKHFFDKSDPYLNRLKRDISKKHLCEEHNIELFYFSHENYNEFLNKKIYSNVEELLNEIKK